VSVFDVMKSDFTMKNTDCNFKILATTTVSVFDVMKSDSQVKKTDSNFRILATTTVSVFNVMKSDFTVKKSELYINFRPSYMKQPLGEAKKQLWYL
jgi:hypothetical protein